MGSVGLPGAFHRLPRHPGQLLTPGHPVQVAGPFEFGSGVPVPGLIKETPANLMADHRFPGPGPGQPERFLLQPRRLMPPVTALINLGRDQQRLEPVPGFRQQPQALVQRFIIPVQQRQEPDTLQRRATGQPAFHCLPVKDHILQRAWISTPNLCAATHQ